MHTILDNLENVKIKIPYASLDYGRMSLVVRYGVEISSGQARWKVCKRYSDFALLHKSLYRIFFGKASGTRKKARLPRKAGLFKPATNISKKKIEKRRLGLERYLAELLTVSLTDNNVAASLDKFLHEEKTYSQLTVETLWLAHHRSDPTKNTVYSLPWARYFHDDTGHYYEITEAKGEHLDLLEARRGEFGAFCQWVEEFPEKLPTTLEAQIFLTDYRFSEKYGSGVAFPFPVRDKSRYSKMSDSGSSRSQPTSYDFSSCSISITRSDSENYKPLSYELPLSSNHAVNGCDDEPAKRCLFSPTPLSRVSSSPDNIYPARVF
eukprot:TRINITY_DN3740_c4_g1_i1.p1 TRINITY_DN3740_c4_g1~~TRINITY_DN3740_c4_g1_i1.p1  ORF type:complete len:322 (+),score=15.20 TRINITY_DN3740_c4_g1_i1:44-1009(+)